MVQGVEKSKNEKRLHRIAAVVAVFAKNYCRVRMYDFFKGFFQKPIAISFMSTHPYFQPHNIPILLS
jgi:hypothetical protein